MYIKQIIWLLALPLTIYLSYRLIIFILKKYEKKYPAFREENPDKDH